MKKYRRIMSHDTEEWFKVWKKNWLLVPVITLEIWWVLMRVVASLKICTLMWNVCRKYIVWSKKSTEELWVITLKNNAKFEKELTCILKNDMMNLTNFDPKLENLIICTLMSSLWAKYTIFTLKIYRGVMCHETDEWCSI